MGVDWSAYIVVGIKVQREDFYEEREEPNCPHQFTDQFKHCPECGVRRGRKKVLVPVPALDEEGGWMGIAYRGLDVISPTHMSDMSKDEYAVLGVMVAKADQYHMQVQAVDPDKAHEARLKVLDAIKYLPALRERPVATHLVMHVSY